MRQRFDRVLRQLDKEVFVDGHVLVDGLFLSNAFKPVPGKHSDKLASDRYLICVPLADAALESLNQTAIAKY